MEQRVRVIDLFAGCGGFSVGFEQAGYEITKAVEFDKAIAMSYSINHLNTIVYALIYNLDDIFATLKKSTISD